MWNNACVFSEEAPVPQFPPSEPEVERKPSLTKSQNVNIDSLLEELENDTDTKTKLVKCCWICCVCVLCSLLFLILGL